MKGFPMYATFVVPAPNGCNLNCPYCAVALRNEARETRLTDGQYIQFLDSTLRFKELKRVSIVGYEPTLDVVIDLVISMLEKAKAQGIETSINTNGVNLPKHIERLAKVVDTVMISLDSHQPDINDKMRGLDGTFVATTAGIRSAVEMMGYKRVIVNTLLTPNKAERIAKMPELLVRLGARRWVISPYINFHSGKLMTDQSFVRQAVPAMFNKARRHGILVSCADEFRVFGSISGVPVYNFQWPGEEGEFVFRLAPNGSCSIGREILSDSSSARMWDGEEDPAKFLSRIM